MPKNVIFNAEKERVQQNSIDDKVQSFMEESNLLAEGELRRARQKIVQLQAENVRLKKRFNLKLQNGIEGIDDSSICTEEPKKSDSTEPKKVTKKVNLNKSKKPIHKDAHTGDGKKKSNEFKPTSSGDKKKPSAASTGKISKRSELHSVNVAKKNNFKKQMELFKKELKEDVSKELAKAKADTPEEIALKKNYEKLGKTMATLKKEMTDTLNTARVTINKAKTK